MASNSYAQRLIQRQPNTVLTKLNNVWCNGKLHRKQQYKTNVGRVRQSTAGEHITVLGLSLGEHHCSQAESHLGNITVLRLTNPDVKDIMRLFPVRTFPASGNG